jgi:hypothetical protein
MKRLFPRLAAAVALALSACTGMQTHLPPSPSSGAFTGSADRTDITRCDKQIPFWNKNTGPTLAIAGTCIFSQGSKHAVRGYIPDSSDTGDVFDAADAAGNLYITGKGFWGVINIYAKGNLNPKTTLYVPDNATGVAVSQQGYIAVLDSGAAQAGVYIFPPNATQACTVIMGTDFGRYLSAVTYDRTGRLFVIGQDYNQKNSVGEAVGGCKAKKIKNLNLQVKLPFFGLQIDTKGNLAVLDQGTTPPQVDVFTGKNTVPSSTVVLSDATPENLGAFTFVSPNHIWLCDFGAGVAREYAYPKGGNSINVFAPFSEGSGIALAASPPIIPGRSSI